MNVTDQLAMSNAMCQNYLEAWSDEVKEAGIESGIAVCGFVTILGMAVYEEQGLEFSRNLYTALMEKLEGIDAVKNAGLSEAGASDE